jgi:hypothetical protein
VITVIVVVFVGWKLNQIQPGVLWILIQPWRWSEDEIRERREAEAGRKEQLQQYLAWQQRWNTPPKVVLQPQGDEVCYALEDRGGSGMEGAPGPSIPLQGLPLHFPGERRR